jgi:hypothetical protein
MSDQNELSGKVSLDVTDYKTATTEINRQIRVIETGFRASASAMGDWDKSSEGLNLRIRALTDQIELQNGKVSAIAGEYNRVAKEKGDTSRAAQELQIKLNKENEALGKMQTELREDREALETMGKESGKAADKLDDLGKKSNSSKGHLNDLKGVMHGVAGVAAGLAAAVAGIAAGLAATIKPASDLAETQSKVGVVFGESSEEVLAFGKDAAESLGMSENAALSAAGTYGNLFRSMGMTEEKSADMSTQLVGLAGDLSSFNNMKPEEVLDKLRAGLSGETEPLKSLGVNLNQALIEEKAFELGLVDVTVSANDVAAAEIDLVKATENVAKSTQKYGADSLQAQEAIVKQNEAEEKLADARRGEVGELDAAAKAQASYALIMEQTSLAQGDFARTSNGLANQQRILTASIENIKATIGTGLLPIIQEVVGGLSGYVSQIGSLIGDTSLTLDEKVGKAGDIVTKIVDDIVAGLPEVSTAAFGIIRAIMVGIINAIPQLVPASVQLLTDLVGFIINLLPIVLEAGLQILISLATGIAEALPELIPTIAKIIPEINRILIENLPLLIDAAIQILLALVNGLVTALPILIESIPDLVTALVTALIQAAPQLIIAAVQLVVALVGGLISAIPQLITASGTIIKNIIEVFKKTNWGQIGKDLVKGVSDGFMAQWNVFKDNVVGSFNKMVAFIKELLGIASPSKVFAGIGTNMAAGLGIGFFNELRSIQSEISRVMYGGFGMNGVLAGAGSGFYNNNSQNWQIYGPVTIAGTQGQSMSESIMAKRY